MLIRVAEVAGALFVVVFAIASLTRRSRRKTDSIGRYARAVSALRIIAAEAPARPAQHRDEQPTADSQNVHVLPEPSSLRRGRRPRESRIARRRPERVAPELLDQRPVIAHLPTTSAPRNGSGTPAG